MELLRGWIISVTAAAFVVAVAQALLPAGKVGRMAKLSFGLVLLLAVLQPWISGRFSGLGWTEEWKLPAAQTTMAVSGEAGEELLKTIIEEELSAYIWDKAAACGPTQQATVTCRKGEAGLPLPVSVYLKGSYPPAQRAALSRQLAEDLGLPQSALHMEEGEP